MKYELALQLKKAGFPQGKYYKHHIHINGKLSIKKQDVYYPTLSELIEACGDGFQDVARRIDVDGYTQEDFIAHGWKQENDQRVMFGVISSTPEEAVSNLYIALNPKKSKCCKMGHTFCKD